MSIKASHLKQYIIEPTLRGLDLYSESAVNLLLGTAAQESHMGEWLHQENGPALGIYQMELNTLNYVGDLYFDRYAGEIKRISNLDSLSFNSIVSNLSYATAMCRLDYRRVKEPLPDANDVHALARYWKIYFNTILGAGTIDQFIENYRKYVESN